MVDRDLRPTLSRLARVRFSRRVALGATIAALGGPRLARAQTPVSATSVSATPVPAPVELPQPQVLRSENGILALTLTCTPAKVDMGVAELVTTYTYDGVVPGYTWEIDPGDELRIHLVNNLPPLDHEHNKEYPNRPHHWTTTNLHTHGLHVSPAENADNPFLEVAPGESLDYEIAVPNDHTGGFFWYHPHKHGAVAQQVRAGMAGALIVRGEIDEVPEVAAAKEQVMVLQAIELGDDFQLLDPIPNPTKTEAFIPRTQILYPVNGVMNPKITMYPGEVQRWRMLNAAEGKFMSLRLADHDLNVLAWDGLTLPAPDPVQDVVLTSGNRVEVLVKAGAPGRYDLILSPGSSQHPDMPGMEHATPVATTNAELVVRPIMTVEVTGDGPEMSLPSSLPAWDPPMLPIVARRQVAYTVQRADDNEFLSFGIDGVPWAPENPPYQMKLGTAEEWTVVNALDPKLPEHAHGIHIHVNPFKVTKINGRTLETPLWRDTFALSGIDNDSLTLEMNLEDFAGKFVEHCHVLSHEDLGMMETLEVLP